MRLVPLLGSALALALAGCGGGPTTPPIVYTPLTPEDEVAFDNGADLIEDPTMLEGPALEDWETHIEILCARADAVVVVQITAVQTSLDLERRESFRLTGDVELERFGDVDAQVSLIVRNGEPGYESIRRAEPRLLNQHYLAFIRWVEGDSGSPVARWHLSPAGERVSRRANTLLERRRPTEDRRRVIVHDHREEDGAEGEEREVD
jgi:hypothetical protein